MTCFYMGHDYQNQQGDGLWYWAAMHKVAQFFDNVIICSLMRNRKRYISNSTSPMDIKPDRAVAFGIEKILKKHITFTQRLFAVINFFSSSKLYF